MVRVRPGPRDETFAAPKPVIHLPGCALAARKKSPLHFFYLQNVRFVRVLHTLDRSVRSACGQRVVRVWSGCGQSQHLIHGLLALSAVALTDQPQCPEIVGNNHGRQASRALTALAASGAR